jgi:hypothetical protein
MLCNTMRLRFCLRGMQGLPIQITMSDLGASRNPVAAPAPDSLPDATY